MELIDQACVDVLNDHVGAPRDPDVPAAGGLARLLQRAFDAVERYGAIEGGRQTLGRLAVYVATLALPGES